MTRTIRRVGVVTVFVVVFALLWFARKVLLLLFAGLLVALILTTFTNLVRRVLPMIGHKAGLAIVLFLLVGAVAGLVVIGIPAVAGQFSELSEEIPKRAAEVRAWIQNSPAIQKFNQNLPELDKMFPASGGGGFTKFFSSTFEAVSSLVFIVFTGLFAAASPQLYRGIIVKLFSPRLRPRANETINRIICTLKYWLLGQSVSMVVVGIVTGVAVAIAGVPFALTLGILAGIFEFIPFIGPLISAIPALLLAFAGGMDKVLIVVAIFAAIQFMEGNVLQPIVQRRAIDLPPVVTLVALLVFGGAFGLLGMFVAAPLAAVILVLLEELYLHEYLQTSDRLLE
jgi:predicted PurR-regulated permease PerM